MLEIIVVINVSCYIWGKTLQHIIFGKKLQSRQEHGQILFEFKDWRIYVATLQCFFKSVLYIMSAELQDHAAAMLQMEDALFVPTATMGNLVAGTIRFTC